MRSPSVSLCYPLRGGPLSSIRPRPGEHPVLSLLTYEPANAFLRVTSSRPQAIRMSALTPSQGGPALPSPLHGSGSSEPDVCSPVIDDPTPVEGERASGAHSVAPDSSAPRDRWPPQPFRKSRGTQASKVSEEVGPPSSVVPPSVARSSSVTGSNAPSACACRRRGRIERRSCVGGGDRNLHTVVGGALGADDTTTA